ncbi:MAG: winged helix-turn-helix domain-containing protein [Sphingomonadales bacterium]
MNSPFLPKWPEWREPARRAGQRITVGQWSISTVSGEVMDSGGNPQGRRIEPTPLRLLLKLAEKPGRTVSREELVRSIWRRRFISEDSINTAIHQIRTALGDDARRPEILQTVPGQGYRLIAPVSMSAETKRPALHLTTGIGKVAALAAALAVLALAVSLGPGTAPAQFIEISPTIDFAANPGSVKAMAALENDLKALVKKLSDKQLLKDGPKIVLESSLHQRAEKFEAFVHALNGARDEILLSKRIALGTGDKAGIPPAELAVLEKALTEIAEPGPRSSLAALEPPDRASFLRARYLSNSDGYRGLIAAAETYDDLLSRYPRNVRIVLANAEANLEIFELGSFQKDRLAKAETLALQAIGTELVRATRGDAHALLAQIKFLKDLDVGAAEANFMEALALAPKNRKTRLRYAKLLRASDRFDAAIREFAFLAEEYGDDAARLEIVRTNYYAGRYETAITGARELTEHSDDKTGAMLIIANAYEAKGDFKTAFFWIKKAFGQRAYDNNFLAELEEAYEQDGLPGYYELFLGRFQAAEGRGAAISPARIAGIALGAGKTELAKTYISKAVDARDPYLYTLRQSPAFKAYQRSRPAEPLLARVSAMTSS